MDTIRLGIALLFIIGIFLPWGQFYVSGLGMTNTVNLNLLDVSGSVSGSFVEAKEKHSYAEFISTYGFKNKVSSTNKIILSVAKRISFILIFSVIAAILFVFANFNYNRRILLFGGFFGLGANILFMIALCSGIYLAGYTFNPIDLIGGIVIKERILFGSINYTLRIWIGWYLTFAMSFFAIYKGRKTKRSRRSRRR